MKLSWRKLSNGELAQDLPEDDDIMCTGDMGDCVCVVVLWNRNPDIKKYDNVRGYHGWGGFGEINLESLFQGVPNDQETVIYGFFGSLALSSNDHARFDAMIATDFPDAYTVRHDTPDAIVNRDGGFWYDPGPGD